MILWNYCLRIADYNTIVHAIKFFMLNLNQFV